MTEEPACVICTGPFPAAHPLGFAADVCPLGAPPCSHRLCPDCLVQHCTVAAARIASDAWITEPQQLPCAHAGAGCRCSFARAVVAAVLPAGDGEYEALFVAVPAAHHASLQEGEREVAHLQQQFQRLDGRMRQGDPAVTHHMVKEADARLLAASLKLYRDPSDSGFKFLMCPICKSGPYPKPKCDDMGGHHGEATRQTLQGLADQLGVAVPALLAANPGLPVRHAGDALPPGTAVRLPPSADASEGRVHHVLAGGFISNACVRCGFFRPRAQDWEPWDGTFAVSDDLPEPAAAALSGDEPAELYQAPLASAHQLHRREEAAAEESLMYILHVVETHLEEHATPPSVFAEVWQGLSALMRAVDPDEDARPDLDAAADARRADATLPRPERPPGPPRVSFGRAAADADDFGHRLHLARRVGLVWRDRPAHLTDFLRCLVAALESAVPPLRALLRERLPVTAASPFKRLMLCLHPHACDTLRAIQDQRVAMDELPAEARTALDTILSGFYKEWAGCVVTLKDVVELAKLDEEMVQPAPIEAVANNLARHPLIIRLQQRAGPQALPGLLRFLVMMHPCAHHQTVLHVIEMASRIYEFLDHLEEREAHLQHRRGWEDDGVADGPRAIRGADALTFVARIAAVLAPDDEAADRRPVESTLHRVGQFVHTARALQRMHDDEGDVRMQLVARGILGDGVAETALAQHIWRLTRPLASRAEARPPPAYLVGLRRSGVLGILHVPTRLLLQLTPTSPHPTVSEITEEEDHARALTAELHQRRLGDRGDVRHRDPNGGTERREPAFRTATCHGFRLEELTGRIVVNPHWKVEGTQAIFRSDEPQRPFVTLGWQGFRSHAGEAVTPVAAFLTAVCMVGRGQ